jgi:hypothetical protein
MDLSDSVWSSQHYQLEVALERDQDAVVAKRWLWSCGSLCSPRVGDPNGAVTDALAASSARMAFGEVHSSFGSIQGLPVAVFHHSPTELDVAVPVEALEHHFGLADESVARWREAFGELAAVFEAVGRDLLQVVSVKRGVVRIEDAFPTEYAPPQSFYFEISEHRPLAAS